MGNLLIRIMTAAGPVIYRIPGAGKIAENLVKELVKNGGKIIRLKKGQKVPKSTVATPANVAKIVKGGRGKPATGPKPVAKKPQSNVKKKNETIASGQQAVSTGGKAKKGGLKTKKREIPANVKVRKTKPGKGGPFAKRTKKQKEADAKREKIQAQNNKNDNRRNPSRDGAGKYNTRPTGRGNVPKSGGAKKGGLKSRLDAKSKKLLAGVGIAGVKVDNLGQSELDIGPRTPLPKKAKNPSAARKKPMQNPRSLKPKKPPVKKPPVKKEMTFGEKFNAERKLGNPTFPYKGKKYTTRLKEESIKDHKKKFGVTGKY